MIRRTPAHSTQHATQMNAFPSSDQSTVALYWDFENIHASILDRRKGAGAYKQTRFTNQEPVIDVEALMEFIASLGSVAINRAYGNWQWFSRYREVLLHNAVELIQLFPPGAYHVLAVIGLVVTWYFNIQFFAAGGSVAPESFFGAALANPLTASITLDVYWAAIVFSIWVVRERHRSGVRRPWLYVAACFLLGLAAFPLYLGRRAQADGNLPQS